MDVIPQTAPDSTNQAVCIIPAYNEQNTVASIARIASAHGLVHSVIVVDDGSSDSTSEKARSVAGVEVIRNNDNRGKGAAMHVGLEASDEPIVLFIDADLVGLAQDHITALVDPVISGEADMTVGLFRGGRLFTDLAHVIAPSLSGQRAVRRAILEGLDMDSARFGIERALTELWQSGAIRVKGVFLHGVTHRTKEEKRGFWPGVKQRIGMFFDILKFECGRLARRFGKGPKTD